MSKLKYINLDQRQDDVGSGSVLLLSSEACRPIGPTLNVRAADVGSHVLKTLFYHFDKIWTSLNIISLSPTGRPMTQHACMGLQYLLT